MSKGLTYFHWWGFSINKGGIPNLHISWRQGRQWGFYFYICWGQDKRWFWECERWKRTPL